ncbi:MAG: response regulator, partial [Rhodobacteraceae bacterium]|nr:response regulator [Paracoccaceae bacterium]
MRILIVEDEMLVAMQIENFLTASGHEVIGVAGRAADAIDLATRQQPELALIDINLAGGDNGIDLAAALRAQDIQIILATAIARPVSAVTS